MISPVDFLKDVHPNLDEFICVAAIFPKDRRLTTDSSWFPTHISDDGKFYYSHHPNYIPINFWIKRREIIKNLSLLHALNDMHWGIYYSVAGFGKMLNKNGRPARTRENVKRIQVLFADFDEPTDASRAFEAGVGFDLLPPPNYVVRTSKNKLQTIWLVMSPMQFETAEDALLYIVVTTGGDPAVKDLSRVLRLPGFKNTKLKSENWPVSAEKRHNKRVEAGLVETLALAGRNVRSSLNKSSGSRPSAPEEAQASALPRIIPASAPGNIGGRAMQHAMMQWSKIYEEKRNKTLSDWGMCCYLRGCNVSADTMFILLRQAHADDGSKGNDEYYSDTVRRCLEQGREDMEL